MHSPLKMGPPSKTDRPTHPCPGLGTCQTGWRVDWHAGPYWAWAARPNFHPYVKDWRSIKDVGFIMITLGKCEFPDTWHFQNIGKIGNIARQC